MVNLQVVFVRTPQSKNTHGKGHIPLAVSGISVLSYGTHSQLLSGRVSGKVKLRITGGKMC